MLYSLVSGIGLLNLEVKKKKQFICDTNTVSAWIIQHTLYMQNYIISI